MIGHVDTNRRTSPSADKSANQAATDHTRERHVGIRPSADTNVVHLVSVERRMASAVNPASCIVRTS
jgi:hypothetical protein